MGERFQKILNRILEWWKKFTTRQKALLISLVAIVAVVIGILVAIMSQPTMVTLVSCETTAEASNIKDVLDGDSVTYELSSDGLTFSVEEADYATASILLGSNGIPSEGYSIDNVFDGSFSTTEADKTKKYQLYLENKFAEQLASISNVESASVSLSIPEDDGTLIAREQDTYASVILNLSDEMTTEQAEGIAKFIATEVGNETTDSVLILDGDGNVLFSGGESASATGTASSQLAVKQKAENAVKSEVRSVMLGTDVYDNVEVGLNLSMDFDQKKVVDHEYYVADGNSQGYLDSESIYESESTGGAAATPGTDSNDDTTYVIQDGETTSSTVSDITRNYLPNERVTETNGGTGTVDLENSSISVVATSYHVYNEETLTADGTLDNMTFDEFVAANSDRIKTTVDDDFVTMVANATGIPSSNITIVAYEVPFFQYASDSGTSWTNYLQIILAVLIFALLGFVVFRSTRKEEEETVEPELSVENLLESTREAETELEDIGFNEKSETRILIEKFVDENPEAAASLLRNWLNEEWS